MATVYMGMSRRIHAASLLWLTLCFSIVCRFASFSGRWICSRRMGASYTQPVLWTRWKTKPWLLRLWRWLEVSLFQFPGRRTRLIVYIVLGFELVDVSSKLPELKRRPGLADWRPTTDRSGATTYESYEEFMSSSVDEAIKGKMTEGHWPPRDVGRLNLSRWWISHWWSLVALLILIPIAWGYILTFKIPVASSLRSCKGFRRRMLQQTSRASLLLLCFNDSFWRIASENASVKQMNQQRFRNQSEWKSMMTPFWRTKCHKMPAHPRNPRGLAVREKKIWMEAIQCLRRIHILSFAPMTPSFRYACEQHSVDILCFDTKFCPVTAYTSPAPFLLLIFLFEILKEMLSARFIWQMTLSKLWFRTTTMKRFD